MTEDVGIKRAVIGGIEVTSFLDPDEPFADESLLGFYTRVAADHCFRSVPYAMQKSGIATSNPPSLPISGAGAVERIAFSLKQDPAAISRRMYPESAARPIMIDFFGTPLRKVFREAFHRRVSPRALKIAPYHRAIWEIKVLSFCPDTKEVLLERCPVCKLRLGWLRTHGIEYCDSCKTRSGGGAVDLRDVTCPLIGSHDEAALEFFCDLIHPLQERKDRARQTLRQPFSGYSNAELFEFAVSLACAEASAASVAKTPGRPKGHDDYQRITPDILSRAARAILEWPSGFHVIAGSVRSRAAQRPAFFGLTKELGPLTTLRREKSVAEGLRKLVCEAIDENMKETADLLPTTRRREHRNREDLITTSDVIRKYGFHRAVILRLAEAKVVQSFRSSGGDRAPRLFVEAEVAALWEAKQAAETESSAAKRLGIPLRCLPELSRLRLIEAMEGPVTKLRGYTRCYRRSSVDGLMAEVRSRIRGEPSPKSAISIDTPVSLGPIGTEAWGNILHAILERKITVWRAPGDGAPLLKSLAIEERGKVTEIFRLSVRSSEQGAATIDALTYREAAKFLDTSVTMIRLLIMAGELPVTQHPRRKLLRSDLRTFKAEKMLTPEIAARLHIDNSRVPSCLAELGIKKPFATVNGKHGHVWLRQIVEDHLIHSSNGPAANENRPSVGRRAAQ